MEAGKFEPRDSLMVDKGFTCEDLFILKNVTLEIPTFFKGMTQLSPEQVESDRKISLINAFQWNV